jgi:ferric-dicitrate binding protein FerR (iron transport regulator)
MRQCLFILATGFAFAACHSGPENALGAGSSFHVGAGYPRSFRLPDGSTVAINPGTTISLDKGFGKDNRDILLDGEAMFEVAGTTGSPFVVHTRDLVIEALEGGSRFHVEANRLRPGEEADLLKGGLRVRKSYHSDTDNEPEVLAAGEMVMINHDIDLMEKEKLSSAELEKLNHN